MHSLTIGSHIALSLSAVVLGVTVLCMAKGTPRHRLIGRIWVAIMTMIAGGSFAIREINEGGFSIIHGLSIFVLASMAYAIYKIRRGNRRAHFLAMIGCLIGTVTAGIFALDRNRLIGGILFGA